MKVKEESKKAGLKLNIQKTKIMEPGPMISWQIEGEFPHSSVGKESACNAGDLGFIPGSGRPPGGRHATHSSILAWRIPWTEEPGRLHTVHGAGKSRTQLNDQIFIC